MSPLQKDYFNTEVTEKNNSKPYSFLPPRALSLRVEDFFSRANNKKRLQKRRIQD